MNRVTVAFLIAGAITVLAACSGRGTEKPIPQDSGPYSRSDFERLRWIEGRWRGSGPSEHNFFEQYRLVGDTLVVMKSSTDSTFSDSTGGGFVRYSDGEIIHESGDAVWEVAGLDSTALLFEPRSRATNSFMWRYESENSWTATIEAPGGEQTYRMVRVAE